MPLQVIQNIHDLLSYIENEKKVGDNMVVTVLRNELLQSINVNLDSHPSFLPQIKQNDKKKNDCNKEK